MSAQTTLICKVDLNGDIRRVHLENPTYLEIVRIAVHRFALTEPAFLRLVFTDPEGDLITINNDESLRDAIACSGTLLRLSLVPAATPLPRAESAAPVQPVQDSARFEAKLQRVRECRMHLARRQAQVSQWFERARHPEGKARATHVQEKLATHLAALQARADKLARKFPEHAARVQAAMAAPSEAEMLHYAAQHAPKIVCDGCQAQITLADIRYNCEQCFDFDLCQACEAQGEHNPAHVLRKMRPEAQQAQPFCPRRRFGRFHHPAAPGFGRPSSGPFFHGHREQPQSPREAIVAFLTEKIVPLFASIPALAALPIMDIAAELLDQAEAIAPKLLKRLHCVVARLRRGGVALGDLMVIAQRLQKTAAKKAPQLVAAAEAIVARHLAELSLDMEAVVAALPQLLQAVIVAFQPAENTPFAPSHGCPARAFHGGRGMHHHRGFASGGACPRRFFGRPHALARPEAEAEVVAAPQHEPTPVPQSEPTPTAEALLAAMSIPAETIQQLLQQTNGDLHLAISFWEAMQ